MAPTAEAERAPREGVTFDEVRRTARWLSVFGASDLAQALRCHPEIAQRAMTALRVNRLLLDTGEWQDGADGPELVYEMVPLPDRLYPRERRTPPEIEAVHQTGGLLLYDLRGLPVRLRTERDMRKSLSTPGARQFHKNRELAFQRQQDAVRKRAEEQAKKAAQAAPPKWQQKKKRAAIAVVREHEREQMEVAA